VLVSAGGSTSLSWRWACKVLKCRHRHFAEILLVLSQSSVCLIGYLVLWLALRPVDFHRSKGACGARLLKSLTLWAVSTCPPHYFHLTVLGSSSWEVLVALSLVSVLLQNVAVSYHNKTRVYLLKTAPGASASTLSLIILGLSVLALWRHRARMVSAQSRSTVTETELYLI